MLLAELIVAQLVKKCSAFYGIWQFIYAFTTSRHVSLPEPVKFNSHPPHRIIIRFNNILPCTHTDREHNIFIQLWVPVKTVEPYLAVLWQLDGWKFFGMSSKSALRNRRYELVQRIAFDQSWCHLIKIRDFGFPLRYRWDLRSFRIVRSVEW
jgi:hypothetical protein